MCIELGAAAEDVPHRHDPDVEGREASHEVQRGLARLRDAHRLVVGPGLVGGVVDGPGVGIPMTRGKIRGPDFHNSGTAFWVKSDTSLGEKWVWAGFPDGEEKPNPFFVDFHLVFLCPLNISDYSWDVTLK